MAGTEKQRVLDPWQKLRFRMKDVFEDYDLHICLKSEISELQDFIHDHWRKDHILVLSQELMDWQHYDRLRNCYNFVIAKHISTREIHGILGFIPTNHFDESLVDSHVWLVTWRIRDDINASALGLCLLYFLMDMQNPVSASAVGINREVMPLYKYTGFKTGTLNHYYIGNKECKDFSLIKNFDGVYCSHTDAVDKKSRIVRWSGSRPSELNALFNDFCSTKRMPTKSSTYFWNRYIDHPIYNYHLYIRFEGSNPVGLIVVRLASYKSSRALRMVDYVGISDCAIATPQNFQDLLSTYNAEYIDFYNFGLNEQTLSQAGFIKRTPSTEVVIPNYFEPFQRENVCINFAYRTRINEAYVIVKGDSDQDRPNSLPTASTN